MKKTIRLNCKETIEIKPISPFPFDPSMHKPGHFPSQDTTWVKGCRWQTMFWPSFAKASEGQQCLGLKFINAGTVKRPKISLEVYSKEKLTSNCLGELIREINYRYDFQADLAGFTERFKNDEQLGPILAKWPGMRVMSPQSLYEYLVIGIVLQNCTVRRSVKMMQALFENYGSLVSFNGKNLYCFWEPKVLTKVSEEELRALKVGYRAKSLKRISEPFANSEINELELRAKSKEEQRGILLSLYGIGPATVGYILFDVFKHYDELSHVSPWEQKIYSKLFFDREPSKPVSEKKLLKFFDKRFGRYKMLAVHYIWEDLWWKREHQRIPWLEGLIRL
ncbi:MAG: hypothetical protein FJ044_01170 [Candidatus Cloacimonetes bacterium]|nr:hypothetical protein [Candidatus Cloacimonadota bacterium]